MTIGFLSKTRFLGFSIILSPKKSFLIDARFMLEYKFRKLTFILLKRCAAPKIKSRPKKFMKHVTDPK